MISVERARGLLGELPLTTVGVEQVSFRDCLGRVLAADLLAPFAQPRDDNSAMDGYAVRSADVAAASEAAPVRLPVVGVSAAGSPCPAPVTPGTCAQVMTGALIPEGADAVLIVEQTGGFVDDVAELRATIPAGANIRRRGEELPEGAPLLAAGSAIGPAELATLTTFGVAEVSVRRRPRIALFATGDELREPGEALRPGDVYNSNLHVLAAVARALGAEVTYSGMVRDDPREVARFLGRAVAENDLVCASGGVSMGRFDYVRDVLLELGLAELFWKVAQKPGKPLFVARQADSPGALFFGLPGNPISTLTCFIAYVAPTLRRLLGVAPAPRVSLPLAASFARQAAKHRFLFGRVELGAEGLSVVPTARLGSHMASAALAANVLLEAPAGEGPLPAGALIVATPLPWTTLASVAGPAPVETP
jgi:molybdopterin molybdotransferase